VLLKPLDLNKFGQAMAGIVEPILKCEQSLESGSESDLWVARSDRGSGAGSVF
jgi:hypothetical protein